MNKRGVAQIIIYISLVAGLITILTATGTLKLDTASIIGSGKYIERPVFKYLSCEPLGSKKFTQEYTLATNGQWLLKPSVSDGYDVSLNAPSSNFESNRFEYYVCNSKVFNSNNCRIGGDSGGKIQSGSALSINNVRNEEVVWVQYQKQGIATGFKWRADSGGNYQLNFQPFGLREYNVLGGSPAQINPNDCTVPTSSDSWQDRFISTNADKVNAEISSNTNERVLQPNEVRWFVSGYVTSASPSFAFDYKNKEAWCRPTGTSAEIYQINTINLASGTYKIASSDWSDLLGTESCCTGDARGDEVCNADFNWEKIQGSVITSPFQTCGSPNWVPFSEKILIKYTNVDGICQQQTQDVECASDFDCKDTNQLCDLNSWSCVDANVNLKGQEIITIPDSKVECDNKGGKWITESKEEKSLLKFITLGVLGEDKLIVTEYCDMDDPDYVPWLIGIGVIILLIFTARLWFPWFRILLSKIGIKL